MTTPLEQIEHVRMTMGALLDNMTDGESGTRLAQRLDEFHDGLAAALAAAREEQELKQSERHRRAAKALATMNFPGTPLADMPDEVATINAEKATALLRYIDDSQDSSSNLLCWQCFGPMSTRDGRYGRFWACENSTPEEKHPTYSGDPSASYFHVPHND